MAKRPRLLILLLSLLVSAGCGKKETFDRPADIERLNAIKSFWRAKFPNTVFQGAWRFSDGPNGERLHLTIPVEIEALYLHDFSLTYLTKLEKESDALTRMIAEDLLLIRGAS